MQNPRSRSRNLYQRRLAKEKEITEEEIQARMRWDLPILSVNHKCGVSLDFPIHNCRPTSICASICYAAQGRQYYRKSIIKSLAVERLIGIDPEHVAAKMVDEAAGRIIRIAGSGDALPEYALLLNHVDQLGGSSWGFTRRIDTHRALPFFMFSIDATSRSHSLRYVQEEVPAARRAYLRRPEDPPSPLEVAVTFPVHGHLTPFITKTPEHETDCPATRGTIDGCWNCRRCY